MLAFLVDDTFTLPLGLRVDLQPNGATAQMEMGVGVRVYRRE